jgi:hypothetical protein
MNGLRLLTLEEKKALAVLADAVDRCRGTSTGRSFFKRIIMPALAWTKTRLKWLSTMREKCDCPK